MGNVMSKTSMGWVLMLCVGLGSMAASAQPYPSKPIRMIVPFGAGSATDNLARRFADKATTSLGAQVVVVNRPGANGLIAAQEVINAPKDGYTVMMSASTVHASNAYLYRTLPYDPVTDFTPISGITINPAVIVVRADLPAQNIGELIEFGKANPGKLNMGNGNASSLAAAALLRSMGGFTGIDVPFKSIPDALTELIGGRIDVLMADLNLVRPHIAAGKLRAIAVTSKSRMPSLPNVPAVAESLPGFEVNGWVAAFGPSGLQPNVVSKLNAVIAEFVTSPEFRKYADEQGIVPFATTPEDLGKFQREQIRFWADVLAKAGVPRSD
jgi:tripartite-type tricarboxylate transporter receptor subunit TctC